MQNSWWKIIGRIVGLFKLVMLNLLYNYRYILNKNVKVLSPKKRSKYSSPQKTIGPSTLRPHKIRHQKHKRRRCYEAEIVFWCLRLRQKWPSVSLVTHHCNQSIGPWEGCRKDLTHRLHPNRSLRNGFRLISQHFRILQLLYSPTMYQEHIAPCSHLSLTPKRES